MPTIIVDLLLVLTLLLFPVFIIAIGAWLLGGYLENTPKDKSDSDNDKVDR